MKFASAIAAALLCVAPAAAGAAEFYAEGVSNYGGTDPNEDTGTISVIIDEYTGPGPLESIGIDAVFTFYLTQTFAEANEGSAAGSITIESFGGSLDIPGFGVQPLFFSGVPLTIDAEGRTQYSIQAALPLSALVTDAGAINDIAAGLTFETSYVLNLVIDDSDLAGATLGPPIFTTDARYTLTYNVAGAPVPEPAAWAMMIAGFGLVGGGMRVARRRVSFAAA